MLLQIYSYTLVKVLGVSLRIWMIIATSNNNLNDAVMVEEITFYGKSFCTLSLLFFAEKGYAFDGSAKGPLLKPTTGDTYGHFPDFPEIQTGIIGYGAGFKKGIMVPVMELVDVAPLICNYQDWILRYRAERITREF
ncbi:MAG: hypothetical protein ABIN89_31760 [Chitinophagaceae bacterium]